MIQLFFIIVSFCVGFYMATELDMKVENKILEPHFIVKTYEVNTCMDGTGKTVIYKTVDQLKVEVNK